MRLRKKGKYTTQLPGDKAQNPGVTRNKAGVSRSGSYSVYPKYLTVVEILKFAVGALAGSTVLWQVVSHFIQRKKYETDVRRLEIENDGLVAEHWKNLYTELRTVQQEQARQIEQLIRENMELREKCDALQRQIETNLN